MIGKLGKYVTPAVYAVCWANCYNVNPNCYLNENIELNLNSITKKSGVLYEVVCRPI